ncbi:hypothetical protein X963_2012 [Burkholderia pseudomallei MSHR7498]|uniref:hypothetical protein n=1 Tax=Burkholderia TaxID=32008 RepID=UPI000530FB32|nr:MULTISPECIES: hypothetical protein [Burkholderia]AJX76037.1 hypothetical protein BG16_3560 [Burkholderia pseudomallei MSHR2543]KGS96650.1 hypothetical protein X963_2012 [Burkholderia pseudomallei MSHR7498]KVE33618.1 hypothetical protein WI93_23665 [Burkholderia vietnamiensis]
MTKMNRDEAEVLIQAFLEAHEAPTAADWKKLIDEHKEHADSFVEAALIRAAGDAAESSPEPYHLDTELADKTVSTALNLLHRSQSVALDIAATKVAAVKSPSARKKLASEVGIGPHVSLLSGVLVGRTIAPKVLLAALARALDTPILALREHFVRAFELSTVPSYKSTTGKPNVPVRPASWDEAVRGLNLDAAETERLLRFSDDV